MSTIVPLFINGIKISALGTSNFPEIANGLRAVAQARAHGLDYVMSFTQPQSRNSRGEPLLVSTHRDPLHHAVWEEDEGNLRNILEADCCYHINHRSQGETPLGAAIRLNRLKIVEIFSGDDRFDFNQICREEGCVDWYPITLAVHLKQRLLVKKILKVKDLDLSVTTNGMTALEMAAKNRQKEPHIYSLLQAATSSEVSETPIVLEDINDILKFVEGDVCTVEVQSKSARKNKPRRKRNKNKSRNISEEKDQEEHGEEASSVEEREDKISSTSDDETLCRLISFIQKSKKEKEAAIREKESDLECPVCLETAGGEIFCCIQQHLVCSQCRPRLVECPQCRQPYPPNPIRHRYAEKIAVEVERLREELNEIVLELQNI